jgi:hypothetical protein
MAQGAAFKLYLRDDRFDKIFLVSDLLKQRLDSMHAQRRIPKFDDIEHTHLLYIKSTFKPYVNIASEYVRVKASGDATAGISNAGGMIQFTIPTFGHFTSDMCIHIKIKSIGNVDGGLFYRYCAMLGVRMFKKISFLSDQVLVDEYTPDDVIAHSKFFVRGDQRTNWNRCFGQQEVKEAIFYENEHTKMVTYCDGLQTPKRRQDEFDLFIPLQFWFCKDVSHALVTDIYNTTASQRTITCEFAPLTDLVQASRKIYGVYGLDRFEPVELPFTMLDVQASLYVNNLFVNPEVYHVFASRTDFSLIRVHKHQVKQLQSAQDRILLNEFKFPVDYFMLGIRNRQLVNDFDRWWLMGTPKIRTNETSIFGTTVSMHDDNPTYSTQYAIESTSLEDVVDSLGVAARGIDLMVCMPSLFYNAYLPLRYPESSVVVSPMDNGAFLINFSLYPGKFNPSGYFNISTCRDSYINYKLKDFYSSITGGEFEMVISMIALNFLFHKDDHLSLFYSL